MKRYLRMALLAPLVVVLALTAGPRLAPAAEPPAVGIAPEGQNALEFVGKVNQAGPAFTGFGYLTRVSGLLDADLFSDPITHDETTARFTYFATTTATSRFLIDTALHAVDSEGTLTFHFSQTPHNNLGDPASFASGVPIARLGVRYQSTLSIFAPNHGIATGVGESHQLAVDAFTVSGQTYRLGRVGLLERLSTNGSGTLTGPTGPNSVVILAGNAVVTGQRGP